MDTKKHFIPTAIRGSRAQIRICSGWRCICGRPLKAYDVGAVDDLIQIGCPRCYRRLLEIEREVEVILSE
jgi:hypothetical protein